MARHGLTFYAVENFDPALWSDILFDGPRRDAQMEAVKQVIRNVGSASIQVFGYNFSLAGVAGHVTSHAARGGAPSLGRARWRQRRSGKSAPRQHGLEHGG